MWFSVTHAIFVYHVQLK